MIRTTLVAMLALALLEAASLPARAAPDRGAFYFRGQLGYTTQSMDDVNSDIRSSASDLGQITTRLDWDELGGAGRFAAEVGYQFAPAFSAGVAVGYQKSRRDHSAFVFASNGTTTITGPIGERPEVSLLDVSITPTLWIPSVPGLHFGGQLGIARGSFENAATIDLTVSDGSFIQAVEAADYDQTSVSAGLFGGYEVALSPALAISGRVGFLYCNFAKMEGTSTVVGVTESGAFEDASVGRLTDSNGLPMEVSFSGVSLALGLTLRFPGAR